MFRSFKIQLLPFLLCLLLSAVLAAAVINTHANDEITPTNAAVNNIESINIPIIMYHAVSDVTSIQGEYVISSAEFENDLKYLKANGFETVFISDIADYVNGIGKLREKSIALTFDDGYYNNYLYVFPLLKKYHFKACIAPVAYYSQMYTENGEVSECYSHCTWPQLKEMVQSGYIELGNHSYNCHVCSGAYNGLGQIQGESDSDYIQRIKDDVGKAQDMIYKNTAASCSFIAYPFGTYNQNTEIAVKDMNFEAALTCTSGINSLKPGDTEKLFHLKRLIRPHNKGLETVLNS